MKLVKTVVWLVILIIIVLVAYSLLNNGDFLSNNNDFNISFNSNKEEFVNYYKDEIRRVVLNKIFDKENPVCNSNCKDMYGIVNDDIDFEVLDIQTDYEIVYKAKSNKKYSSINIDQDDCKSISNSSCSGNIIKNTISKEWMK